MQDAPRGPQGTRQLQQSAALSLAESAACSSPQQANLLNALSRVSCSQHEPLYAPSAHPGTEQLGPASARKTPRQAAELSSQQKWVSKTADSQLGMTQPPSGSRPLQPLTPAQVSLAGPAGSQHLQLCCTQLAFRRAAELAPARRCPRVKHVTAAQVALRSIVADRHHSRGKPFARQHLNAAFDQSASAACEISPSPLAQLQARQHANPAFESENVNPASTQLSTSSPVFAQGLQQSRTQPASTPRAQQQQQQQQCAERSQQRSRTPRNEPLRHANPVFDAEEALFSPQSKQQHQQQHFSNAAFEPPSSSSGLAGPSSAPRLLHAQPAAQSQVRALSCYLQAQTWLTPPASTG